MNEILIVIAIPIVFALLVVGTLKLLKWRGAI